VRLGSRFTRDLEDVVAYLAQRTDKPTITRLLRCSWEAVAVIVVRVVAAHVDDHRLDGSTASASTRSPTARATAT
jgi:transposase